MYLNYAYELSVSELLRLRHIGTGDGEIGGGRGKRKRRSAQRIKSFVRNSRKKLNIYWLGTYAVHIPNPVRPQTHATADCLLMAWSHSNFIRHQAQTQTPPTGTIRFICGTIGMPVCRRDLPRPFVASATFRQWNGIVVGLHLSCGCYQ